MSSYKRVCVTGHGFDRAKAMQAARTLLAIRRGVTLGGLPLKELRDEGRP